MKHYLGVDLGGTNIRVGKVDELGKIIQVVSGPSDGTKGPDVVLANLFKLIEQIENYSDCSGIGLGVPGPVDTANGIMTLSTNLEGFRGFKLKEYVEKRLNMPAFVDNDANVAGLAEAFVGAGKDKKIVYYFTISTGIGGALIVNKQLISGKSGYAGEIGNIIVDPHKSPNSLGLNTGSLESEAGGRSLTLKAQKIFGDKIKHAGDFFALVENKNPKALVLFDEFITQLATGISAVGHIIDPHVFVVGGGMLKSKDVWFDKFVDKYRTLVHPGMSDVEFKTAVLEEPGLVGAAMLPLSKEKK